MATSAVQPNYYCHQCDTTITPNLEDYTCPSCNTGFIEALGEGGNGNDSGDGAAMLDFEGIMDSILSEHEYDEYSGGVVVQRRRRDNQRRNRGPGTQLFRLPIQYLSQRPTHTQLDDYRQMLEPIENLFNSEMLEGLFATLLSQQQSGVPPAPQESISSLPKMTLTEEQAKELQSCSICFDEFVKDSVAIKLNCSHVFHESCLVKWLNIHGTCPVCRKDLQGNDTTRFESSDNPNQASTSSDV